MNLDKSFLLTDEQMRTFITEGFLILKTNFSKEFHQGLVKQLTQVYEEEGNPGNNLLPRIREVQKIFENPVIKGALTSVLGENYLLHTHRHGHYNNTPSPGGWHKDSYWGYNRMRNHHSWWAMIMYFPQDTPVELGPTGIMPGTQYYETRTFDAVQSPGEALASGEAGTFALIQYDIWHRSTANTSGQHRYMLKFEFMRTEAPQAPSWNNASPEWSEPKEYSTVIDKQPQVWHENWKWLSGEIGGLHRSSSVDTGNGDELLEQLKSQEERVRMHAAYTLAGMGQSGIDLLQEGLHEENIAVSKMAAYGLSVSGEGAVDGLIQALKKERVETLVHAAFALGELRELAEKALPDLVELMNHSSEVVRQAVVEALGSIGAGLRSRKASNETVATALIAGLQDEDTQTRFMAALAIIKLGPDAEAAIPQLQIALEDENRYVRGHAAEALHYIGTSYAKDVLIDHLLANRWCASTTKASAFYP